MVTIRGPLFPTDTTQEVTDEPATKPKEDHKLKADSAHPTTVRGSDSGRTEGETAGESEISRQK
jgi:hypothetical protein